MDDTNWSDRITHLESWGWTQAAIAKRTGLSPGALGDLKSGRSQAPTGMSAVRLHSLHTKRAKPPKLNKGS